MYFKIRMKAKLEGKLHRYCPSVYKKIKFLQMKCNKCNSKIISVINTKDINVEEFKNKSYKKIIENYLQHKFDILGSGWISFNHDTDTDSNYKFIKWNIDFRSGYIWNNENNSIVQYDNPKGSDIKNVWELGRLQHLLRLALSYLNGLDKRYIIEFYNQTNDFIENNPIGQGINWTCSMEVAIRAINMLLSYDIFSQCDIHHILNKEYKDKYAKYIYEHGRFIINNLEFVKGSKINHNHYYCDILGLLYISSYLENEKWYMFSKSEFEKISMNQFLKDGANMEGSTCYHKLCIEILQLGVALIIHNDGVCNKELLEVLQNATEYLETIMLPNGLIPQIGDNDSAEILKISYEGYGVEEYKHEFYGFEQEHNENRESTRNSMGVLTRSLALGCILNKKHKISNIEYSFIKSLVGNYENDIKEFHCNINTNTRFAADYISNNKNKKITEFMGNELKKGASKWKIFPNVGICVYKSDNLYVCLNIGKEEDKKFMGHVHDDVLHVELFINGKPIIEDPGTLTYTADEQLRNYFRSYKKHYIPIYDGKMDITEMKPFDYVRKCQAKIVNVTEDKIHVIKYYDSIEHHRIIEINDSNIKIIDESNYNFELPSIQERYWFSDNYGSVIEKKIEY